MKVRQTGIALALLALAVFTLAVRPTWDDAAQARGSSARAIREWNEARAELGRLERRVGRLPTQAASATAIGPAGGRLLRARVLRVLEGTSVRGVALDVQAGETQDLPKLRLSAEGSFAELVALAGRLAEPSTGLALDQVRITPSPTGLRLELGGTAWGDGR